MTTTSHPVRSRTVPVAGATVSLRESGDPAGPAAVPLHGGSSSAATWDRLATALTAAGHHVIAADLRGHGSSARTRDYPLDGYSDDIRGLMDALEIGSAALVGHSLGGYAASVVAQREPERIETAGARVMRIAAITSVAGVLHALALAAPHGTSAGPGHREGRTGGDAAMQATRARQLR